MLLNAYVGGDVSQAAAASARVASSHSKFSCSLVFGSDTELSGSYEIYGAPAAQGLDAAAKAINAAGGVKVGHKRCQFVAANEDNMSEPSQVFTAAEKVIDKHAVAALGPTFDTTVAYNAFKKAGVLDFVTEGTVATVDLALHPHNTPLAFGMIPFQLQEHEAYYRQALAAAPSIKTVAVMYPNTAGGKIVDEDCVQAAKAVGLKVVSNVAFPATTTNFSTFLATVKATHPDLLFAEQSSTQSTAIMEQGVPLGVAKYYMSETATAQTIESAPGLSNATVFLPTFAPTYSTAETLPTNHPAVIFGHAKAPLVPGAAIVLYYAAWLVKQAVQKAGSTSAQAVASALVGQSYSGPFGKCTMVKQRYMKCETVFIEVQGKKVTVSSFSGPYTAKPTAVYNCAKGVCTKTS